MRSLLAKLFPFGHREALEVSEKTQERVYALIAENPELWEGLKEVAYMVMNQKTRAAVLARPENRNDFVTEILAIDDFLKTCLTIKEKRRDVEVETSGHLPVMDSKKKADKEMKKAEGKNIFFYLASKDLKDNRTTIKR